MPPWTSWRNTGRQKKLRFTLNANNLFDQKYKTIPDALSFGAPRHVMATFRYEF